MTRADGARFTAALYRIIERDFWGSGAAGQPPPAAAAAAGAAPAAR
jgi:hypothetical protein